VPKDQAIYDQIYQAIVQQRLSPGTKLGEEALCEAFGVSRTRIRRVLLRLAHGSMVELRPNRGAYVASPSVEEAKDVFEARRTIEPTMVRRAAERITAAQIAGLRDVVAADREAQATGDRSAAIKASGDFHLTLAEIADNHALQGFLLQLVSQTSLIIAMYGGPITVQCSLYEHTDRIEALEARDGEAAVRAMDHHLNHIESLLDLTAPVDHQINLKAVFGGFAAAS
jgi:DNA-binding GntR family transcriptional regulator